MPLELLIRLRNADGRPLLYHRVPVFSQEDTVRLPPEVARSNAVYLACISMLLEEGLLATSQPQQHVLPYYWHDGQALAHASATGARGHEHFIYSGVQPTSSSQVLADGGYASGGGTRWEEGSPSMSQARRIEQPGVFPMTMGAALPRQSDLFMTGDTSLRLDTAQLRGMGERQQGRDDHDTAAAGSWDPFEDHNQNDSFPAFTDMSSRWRTSFDTPMGIPGPSLTRTDRLRDSRPPAMSSGRPGGSIAVFGLPESATRASNAFQTFGPPPASPHAEPVEGGHSARVPRSTNVDEPVADAQARPPPVALDSPGVGAARPQGCCMFGPQACTHPLADTSTRALKEHLEEYHSAELDRNADGQYKCHWRIGPGSECDKYLSETLGLAKHIGRVHLRTGAVRCGFCDLPFSRPDALERHLLKACKEKPATVQGETDGAYVTGT